MRFCQIILTRLWASFFKISTFSTFPDIESDWFVVYQYNLSTINLTLFFALVKNRDHTTHQSDYMSGKVKKAEILKNEAQSQVRIF